MASDRTAAMRSPYDNSAIITTTRGKGANSRKLTVGIKTGGKRTTVCDLFATAKICDANNDLY